MSAVNKFDSPEDAFFWAHVVQRERNAGARMVEGRSLTPRPCTFTDIFRVIQSLYEKGKLSRADLFLLKVWGEKCRTPDPRIVDDERDEREAADRFKACMKIIGDELSRRGFLEPQTN